MLRSPFALALVFAAALAMAASLLGLLTFVDRTMPIEATLSGVALAISAILLGLAMSTYERKNRAVLCWRRPGTARAHASP